WGTALAVLAARTASKVNVWTRESATAAGINSRHENPDCLPGIVLPAAVVATTDVNAVASAEAVLVVVPAQALPPTLATVTKSHAHAKPIILCAKGIEKSTGCLLTEVLHDVLPDADSAILSGPSFAGDVARGLPTAITIAGRRETVGR